MKRYQLFTAILLVVLSFGISSRVATSHEPPKKRGQVDAGEESKFLVTCEKVANKSAKYVFTVDSDGTTGTWSEPLEDAMKLDCESSKGAAILQLKGLFENSEKSEKEDTPLLWNCREPNKEQGLVFVMQNTKEGRIVYVRRSAGKYTKRADRQLHILKCD